MSTMKPNPVLQKLGYSDADRLVILHTDDIGMCQASVQAYADLWEFGGISSGAIMIPCAWAKTAAEYCHAHPGVDMGVHITLTAEWPAYRWRPVSSTDTSSGLMDHEGFFWRTSKDLQENADQDSVTLEIQKQVRLALDWGVQATHMDTHMGSIAHAKFIPAYIQTGMLNNLPVMVPRGNALTYQKMGLDTNTAGLFSVFTAQLEEQGLPLIDALVSMPLDQPDHQIEIAKTLLGNLTPGVTHFLFHPAIDTPELRSICPDWPSRVANYLTFMSSEIKDFIKNTGIQVIGYQDLKNIMPQAGG